MDDGCPVRVRWQLVCITWGAVPKYIFFLIFIWDIEVILANGFIMTTASVNSVRPCILSVISNGLYRNQFLMGHNNVRSPKRCYSQTPRGSYSTNGQRQKHCVEHVLRMYFDWIKCQPLRFVNSAPIAQHDGNLSPAANQLTCLSGYTIMRRDIGDLTENNNTPMISEENLSL